ncbi:MAG: hypothetical protein ACTHVY_06040 [Brevibacterium yomogidense]|uniref:Uncharacterized protein n=1 Tax=Brevibacterium yomogidense TaxID=946573 RepID=A0A1X6XFU7_9MICO|nr:MULTISPECIES: hypothetical protein [Brevibacterium]SLM98144.1 hypothetical protein FM105_08310 [Brevibacterium yomogidense]SMX91905.1 hypothetical protein BSP109_02584 [Brevibacterium sp. Mu109]
MKRIGDFLVNTPSAVVVAAAGAILLVCALIPPLHGIAWVLLLLAVLLVLGAVIGWSRTWTHLQDRIDALVSEAASAHDDYIPVELSQTPQEELARADAKIAADIEATFPEDDGIVRRLRIEAEVTDFPEELTAPLTAFLADNSHTRFDEPQVHRAFMSLYRAARALDQWIRTETAQFDGQRVLVPGDTREGGWQSFADAKRSGEEHADAFLTARSEFSRVVLVSSLLED